MDYSPFLRDEPFIISIAGGKEGTGKSLVSTNIAIQMAQAGLRVILVDHEMGGANMQSMYHIAKEEQSRFSDNPRNKLESFLMEEGIPNLLMIPGTNIGLDFASINNVHKAKFFNQIKEISSADVIIIDLGGSSTEQMLDIFLLGHAGVLVTTTEPAGVINAYEFLKKAVYRVVYRMFRGQRELQDIVAAMLKGEQTTVEAIAAAVAPKSPWAARTLLEVCEDLDFTLILNRGHSAGEVQLGAKVHDICRKYLSIDINFAGLLLEDNEIPAHSIQMAPLSITHPTSITCRALNRMAGYILSNLIHQANTGTRNVPFSAQMERASANARDDAAHSAHTLQPT